jgi:hypothetical protein
MTRGSDTFQTSTLGYTVSCNPRLGLDPGPQVFPTTKESTSGREFFPASLRVSERDSAASPPVQPPVTQPVPDVSTTSSHQAKADLSSRRRLTSLSNVGKLTFP